MSDEEMLQKLEESLKSCCPGQKDLFQEDAINMIVEENGSEQLLMF